MKWHYLGLAVAATAFVAPSVLAQPRDQAIPPAFSTTMPAGISIKKTPIGDIYVDSQGRTLYGMATGNLRLDTRDPNTWCKAACLDTWQPVTPPPAVLAQAAATPAAAGAMGGGRGGAAGAGRGGAGGGAAAAAGAGRGGAGAGGAGAAGLAGIDPQLLAAAQAGNPQAIAALQAQAGGGGGAAGRGGRGGAVAPAGPDWTVVQGVNGPQLMYKRAHLVYTRKGEAPGGTSHDGEDNFLWNVLRYVPPVPKLAAAPSDVATSFIDGAYAMVIKGSDSVLYTCAAACPKATPFKTGIVSQGVGDWTVSRSGDTPQWMYKGKPVYINQGKSAAVPVGAAVLRP